MGAAHLLTAAVAALPAPVLASPPPGACTNAPPARPVVAALPWAQVTLGAAAVRPFSTGAGVTVAVVDSGVDRDHPQLRRPGAVLRGEDFHLVGDLPGDFDCDSHGTAVASIVAARPVPGAGFAGLAPDATILPVRVSDRGLTDGGAVAMIDPVVLARGIWYAADHGATVLNLSLAGAVDDPLVRDAVAHAVQKDVLVVAAAGNGQQGAAVRPSYPAAYPGVLGVGAVDQAGARVSSSQIGPYVDLVAPGGHVLGAARAGGHQDVTGTSFAAPFVAATAALVRSAWPRLSAPEVARRLIATATPGPGGAGYGAGLVNPYRAVTDGLTTAAPAVVPPLRAPAPPPAARPAPPVWRVLGLAVLAVAVVLLGAAVTARGRRTGWRARTAPVPADRPGPTDGADR